MPQWQEISARLDRELVEQVEDIYTAYGAAAITTSSAEQAEEIFDLLDNEFRLWRFVEIVGLFPIEMDPAAILLELNLAGIEKQNLIVSEVKDQDWVLRWQQEQKPQDFGHGLVVSPPDLAASLSSPRILILEPGRAFGTGTHPTTKMCLRWIAAREWKKNEVAVDLGCGSGILAMAMAKCGAGEIFACDIDPLALQVAGENVVKNSINNITVLLNEQLTVVNADVVVANILLEPLITEKPFIEKLMRTGAELVMTGILKQQASNLIAAFAPHFQLEVTCTDEEWALVTGIRC
ncbi:MAG: 50S ribosomal protein L11 methyltransferase [Gammaproteobacteria bacterium]